MIQNVGIHVGGATFNALEAANWRLITPMVTQAWQANFYYYAGEQAFNNGVLYRRTTSGMSTATFDATEAADWAEVGTYSNPFIKIITDADSPYTVTNIDSQIFIDSSAGAVVYDLDQSLPEGKMFTMTYTQTANPITIQATGGTVMSPTTFTQVASFTTPGSVGQSGSTQFYRRGTEFFFNG